MANGNGGFRRHLTPGKIACLGVMLALIGNELTDHLIREVFEVAALLIAAIGLMLE